MDVSVEAAYIFWSWTRRATTQRGSMYLPGVSTAIGSTIKNQRKDWRGYSSF